MGVLGVSMRCNMVSKPSIGQLDGRNPTDPVETKIKSRFQLVCTGMEHLRPSGDTVLKYLQEMAGMVHIDRFIKGGIWQDTPLFRSF